MKTYQVWSEGYAATGESSGATFHGNYSGETFKDAVQKWADQDPKRERLFDKTRLTYWGCKFYDNEIDARGSFG